jgi:flavin-dependent dehydrogenase
MRAAALRLGGQGLSTTYDDHLLIIGDAAGHIDPLTGACAGRGCVHGTRALKIASTA